MAKFHFAGPMSPRKLTQLLAFLHDPIVEDDRKWFAENPDRRHRVRSPGFGEAAGFQPAAGDFKNIVAVCLADDGEMNREPSRVSVDVPEGERYACAAYILAGQGQNFLKHRAIVRIAKKLNIRGAA